MRKETKKWIVLMMLPVLFLLFFASTSYAKNFSNSVVAKVTVLPLKLQSSIDIKFFFGFFFGQLKDTTGKGLANKPVTLTVQYYEYSNKIWQLKTATYDLKTGANGYWNKWFGFDWKSATIVFAGDATNGPASATITSPITTTTTTKPPQCKGDDNKCDGNNLEKCDDGKWILVKSCAYGCSDEKCNPAPTVLTIQFSQGSFSGYLKDKTTGKGLTNEPVKLTVQYTQNKATSTKIYNLQTGSDGKWIQSFGLDWKSAKIEFAGNSEYISSSATINK